MEQFPKKGKHEITSQEDFQNYYEKGLANVESFEGLQKFLGESSGLGFKLEVSGKLIATAILKGIKITAQEVAKAIKSEK